MSHEGYRKPLDLLKEIQATQKSACETEGTEQL